MTAYAARQWQANGSKNQLVLGPNGQQAVISVENLGQISTIKIPDPGSATTNVVLTDSASGTQTIKGNLVVTGTVTDAGGGSDGPDILTGNLVFTNTADREITFNEPNAAAGVSLSILGNQGSAGNGGDIIVKSGAGSAVGGSLVLEVGQGGGGTNGTIEIGASTAPSSITIGKTDMATNILINKTIEIVGNVAFDSGNTRDIRFNGPNAGAGKQLNILGNDSDSATGGHVLVQAGAGDTTGGDLLLEAGEGSTVDSGAISIGTNNAPSKITIGAPSMTGNIVLDKNTEITSSTNQLKLGANTTLNATASTAVVTRLPTITGTIASTTGSNLWYGDIVLSTSNLQLNNQNFVNINGLQQTVVPGTYIYSANLYSTAGAADGIKYGLAFTASLTQHTYNATAYNQDSPSVVHTDTSQVNTTGLVFISVADTICYTQITGSMIVATGGTINMQAAKHSAGAEIVQSLIGSFMQFIRIL